jgi:GT2 family glycosyltransferase
MGPDTIPTYSISIAVFNNLQYTKRCIDSIVEAGPTPENGDPWPMEILIADNGSTDGTFEHYAAILDPTDPGRIPDMRVERFRRNHGFIHAQNHNVALARGEFFVVLNNDTEVGAGWLERMRAKFDANPKLAICGAAGTWKRIDPTTGYGTPGDGPPQFVEGSCLMMRTEMARKYGPFDTVFGMGFCEDADLSFRVRSDGLEIDHAAFGFAHHGGKTREIVPEMAAYHHKNHKLLLERWGAKLMAGEL